MLRRVFRSQAQDVMLRPNLDAGWVAEAWSSWEPPVNLIVGESYHEESFADLVGPPRPEGYLIPVVVGFFREPENPYDGNAIRAEVSGHTVGHVGRAAAAGLAARLDELSCKSFELAGVIRGGSISAPNFGVQVWLDRRATSSPRMTNLMVETAPWPPAEDAGWKETPSTDVPADPFERYEWLNERVEEMWQHRRYRDVLPVCLEALDLLPTLGTDEWGIRDTSAFGYATLLMGVLGDLDGITRLRSHPNVVDLVQPVEEIEEASRDAVVVDAVLALVAQTPGLVQKDLPAMLDGVAKDRIRRVCYWAAAVGRLAREKTGASYLLTLPNAERAAVRPDALQIAASTFQEHPDPANDFFPIEHPRPLDELLRPVDARIYFESAPAPYDDPEGYDRWRRHYDEVHGLAVERNLRGANAEKLGDIEMATSLYEANVRDGFEGNHPYDRLAVLYRKGRRFNDEARVLERAVEVFSSIRSERQDVSPKLIKFQERLQKARALVEAASQ